MKEIYEHLAWYLGCGLFQSGNYTILARDDQFSDVELEFVRIKLDSLGTEYILDKEQIKIKNDKRN